MHVRFAYSAVTYATTANLTMTSAAPSHVNMMACVKMDTQLMSVPANLAGLV